MCSPISLASTGATLIVTVSCRYVLNVQLNRVKQLNTMNRKFWDEVKECWNIIADDSDVRVVILSSNARLFTAGLDLSSISMTDPTSGTTLDAARIGFGIVKGAKAWQDTFNAVEVCRNCLLPFSSKAFPYFVSV